MKFFIAVFAVIALAYCDDLEGGRSGGHNGGGHSGGQSGGGHSGSGGWNKRCIIVPAGTTTCTGATGTSCSDSFYLSVSSKNADESPVFCEKEGLIKCYCLPFTESAGRWNHLCVGLSGKIQHHPRYPADLRKIGL